MKKQLLLETLNQLHQTLEQAERSSALLPEKRLAQKGAAEKESLEEQHLDAELKNMLAVVTADINQLLTSETEPSTTSASTTSGPTSDSTAELPDQLQDLAQKFEVSHPQIADLIKRLSDGLANMGI